MQPILIVAFSSFFVGLLLIGLSVPFLRDAVPPNRFYGFRTTKTMSSPSNWYAANKFAATASIMCGGVMVLLVALYLGLSNRLPPSVLLFVGCACEVVPLVALSILLAACNAKLPPA